MGFRTSKQAEVRKALEFGEVGEGQLAGTATVSAIPTMAIAVVVSPT